MAAECAPVQLYSTPHKHKALSQTLKHQVRDHTNWCRDCLYRLASVKRQLTSPALDHVAVITRRVPALCLLRHFPILPTQSHHPGRHWSTEKGIELQTAQGSFWSNINQVHVPPSQSKGKNFSGKILLSYTTWREPPKRKGEPATFWFFPRGAIQSLK